MNKNKTIDKLFLAIVSIQTIIMAIAFIIQVLRIYYGNNALFTREICGKYILQILPILILWILIIIASFVYFYIKEDNKKQIAKLSNVQKYNNLKAICPNIDDLSTEKELLHKEEKYRFVSKIVNIIIVFFCSLMGLGYLINVKHFESNGDLINQAVNMTIHLSPWVIITFVSLIICTFYEEISCKKSNEILKQIIKNNGKKPISFNVNKNEKKIINIARISILVIAVIFIITGIYNGGAEDVFNKAINICTECIGLG